MKISTFPHTAMRPITALLKEPEGLRYHGGATAYALVGYGAGLTGILADSWIIGLCAALLLGHAMTIAAYMVHECAHNLVFGSARHNAALGRLFTWVSGASYGTFEDMRYKHFRHHVDVDDVAWFDYERFFRNHPLVLKLIERLEWCYIPAHEFLMHGILVLSSFMIPQRRRQRTRNVRVIVVRFTLFAVLAVYSPRAAALYIAAYAMMLTTLRFMDSIQHDYGYTLTLFDPGNAPRKGQLEWEQEHTFSNPHTFDDSVWNWLTLNFGFHNAHHADMDVPWYRLPAKHRELFGDNPENVIPLNAQLKIFHKQRVRRIVGNHAGNEPEGRAFLAAARRGEVYGGNAASFLTPF